MSLPTYNDYRPPLIGPMGEPVRLPANFELTQAISEFGPIPPAILNTAITEAQIAADANFIGRPNPEPPVWRTWSPVGVVAIATRVWREWYPFVVLATPTGTWDEFPNET